jgi:hypothetical protein
MDRVSHVAFDVVKEPVGTDFRDERQLASYLQAEQDGSVPRRHSHPVHPAILSFFALFAAPD